MLLILVFTGPLIEILEHVPVKMVTEINWLFAFLTAKEDSTVSALINEGLIEVRTSMSHAIHSHSAKLPITLHSLVQLTVKICSLSRCLCALP